MPREKTKDEKKEEKPPETRASRSMPQALKEVLAKPVRESELRRQAAKAGEELASIKKGLKERSPFLAHMLEDEERSLRKRLKGRSEELAPELAKLAIDFSSGQGIAEHLRTATIPNLEIRLQARATDHVKKELERAALELRQLDALNEYGSLLQKLEFVLQYNYLPRAMEHETRDFRRILEAPRTPQVEREAALGQLEEKLDEFRCRMEPTKLREYLLEERKAVQMGARGEPGADEAAMIEMASLKLDMLALDIEKAKERIAETAPISQPGGRIAGFRNHFRHSGYEMTTNSEGRRIYLVSAPDGSEVKFSRSYVLVISPFSETAIYERDEETKSLLLAQVTDSKGCIFKFREGKMTSARDAEGNWFFFDPAAAHPYEILDRDGKRVLAKGEKERLLARMEAARGDYERDSELDETERRHFNFDGILETASKARKAAKKEHARIALRTPEAIEYTDAFIGKARASLIPMFVSAGLLEHRKGAPRTGGMCSRSGATSCP